MAKERKGQFVGGVGNVVLYEWRGMRIMRSKMAKKSKRTVKARRTPAQAKQISRFAFASKKLRHFRSLIEKTFEVKEGELPQAQAVRYLLRGFAIKGDHPNLELDYSQLLVARGPVRPVTGLQVSREDNKFIFTWTNDSHETGASADDEPILVVYSEQDDYPLYSFKGWRSQGRGELKISSTLKGTLHAWMSFRRKDGKAADSVYGGSW